MNAKTINETYFVVGAGFESGSVFLTNEGDMGARPENARRFTDELEAKTVGIHDAKKIPAGKQLDWRVIGVHTTHVFTPT
ncbi:hypothetical protein [Phenylobacterium soli]|uniref:hypothetical protein n=1 Tax=Phenylobacterium soli TaxID=2170551 RepID=UPI0010580E0E|nr:hypothetical protein [Phenylobacterium soli]